MVDLPYTAAIRGIRPEATTDEEGQAVVRTRKNSDGTGPWVWKQQRNWVRPDIDPTGATDATAAILAAANSRPGACVYLPEGTIRVGTTSGSSTIFNLASLPKGTTITGPERGQKSGHRLYNDGNPIVGATLYVYGTGRLFVMGEQMRIGDIEIYYPGQAVNATPTAYDYAFDITGHGSTVQNVTAVNPYKLLRCTGSVGGCRVDNIWGFPLYRGITLGRVTDVARITNVNFNPTSNFAHGATLTAWVLANGIGFLVDGAEAAQFEGCFTYGHSVGLHMNDEDADGFQGAYFSWRGGGWDQCTVGVRHTKYCWQGGVISGASLAPLPGSYGVLFEDTTAPAAQWQRARLEFTNMTTAGVHFRTFSMASGAYGICHVIGGYFFGGPSSAHFANDSAHGTMILDGVVADSGYTRTSVSNGGQIYDRDGIDGLGTPRSFEGHSLGADLGDSSPTITWSATGNARVMPDGVLTANRTIQVNDGAELTGEEELLYIGRQGFTTTIKDNGGTNTLMTVPVNTRMRVHLVKGTHFTVARAVRLP